MEEKQLSTDKMEKNTEKSVLTDEEKEKIYKRIKKLEKSTKCIERYELYIFVYKTIIQKAKKIHGYKDADASCEKYEKELQKLTEKCQEEIYQKAIALKENVKKAEDLQWIRKEASRIPGYKDIEEIKKWCDTVQDGMEKREKRNAWIRICIIVIVVSFLVLGGYYLKQHL